MENRQVLFETILVIFVTIILSKKFSKYESLIIVAIPMIYVFLESIIRHRSFKELGFNIKDTIINLRENWVLFFLVGVIIPLLTIFIAKLFCPEFIVHVKNRLPASLNANTIVAAIISLVIGTLLEEMIFRAFIQGKLSLFIGVPFSIIIASILFAFMHISKGSTMVVVLDLSGIFIDSILYGVIFSNTNNLFASWAAHFTSDFVALLSILFLI